MFGLRTQRKLLNKPRQSKKQTSTFVACVREQQVCEFCSLQSAFLLPPDFNELGTHYKYNPGKVGFNKNKPCHKPTLIHPQSPAARLSMLDTGQQQFQTKFWTTSEVQGWLRRRHHPCKAYQPSGHGGVAPFEGKRWNLCLRWREEHIAAPQ